MIYLELFRQERFSANGFFVGNCISVDRQSPVSERQQFNDCWHVLGGTLRYRALPFQEVAMGRPKGSKNGKYTLVKNVCVQFGRARTEQVSPLPEHIDWRNCKWKREGEA